MGMKEFGSMQQTNALQTIQADNTTSTDDLSIEDQVKVVVGKAAKNDKGVYVYAEDDLKDLDPMLQQAAKSELRAKNHQSSYTNSQKELAKSTAMTKKLVSKLSENLTVSFSAEDQAKLDAVKDKPEEYHALRVELENSARTALETELTTIETESATLSELETRTLQLNAFNESSEIKITQNVIDDQLPASYSKKLENKEVTFTEFLTMAQQFLTKNKVVSGDGDGDEDDNPVDMEKLSGSSTPNQSSTGKDIVTTYENTVY